MDTIIVLLTLINSYRADYKLPPLRLDSSLNKVAMAHAKDFCDNVKEGNGHLWSDGSIGQKACEKSLEYGYPVAAAEIAHYHYPDPGKLSCDPKCCFMDWVRSPDHSDVILERNSASTYDWKACGIAIYKGFACVWFGIMEIFYTKK